VRLSGRTAVVSWARGACAAMVRGASVLRAGAPAPWGLVGGVRVASCLRWQLQPRCTCACGACGCRACGGLPGAESRALGML
jgi:hypothetical protein